MPHNKSNASRKGNKSNRKLSLQKLQYAITEHLALHANKAFTLKQLKSKIKADNTSDSFVSAIQKIEQKNLILTDGDRIRWNPNASLDEMQKHTDAKIVTGRVDMTRTGAAYIITEASEQDIYVPARSAGTAMNRDIVKVYLNHSRSGRRPEGKIVEIIKRAITHVIGTLKVYDKYAIVYPLLEGNFPEVLIHHDGLAEAEDGQAVLVEITEWGQSQNKSIWGQVEKVLHQLNRNDLAMQSILLSNGFQLEFPPEVITQSEAISSEITQEEIDKRLDLRETLTFTIDPDTAKDFDDAISYKILEDQKIEIGVHIADVTHYLEEGTALDKEAYERSTSVYLVDRVVPMLPERLSNDLCSLNPHEDKLTFSAIFVFDEKFKIVKEWFGKTIIHSNRRFTYEEAQECIETGKGDYAIELRHINAITSKLRKERFKNGAINFESDEVKFILDEDNKPIGVYTKERKDAHLLIEDLMLQANKSVATYLFNKAKPEIPSVYRVHDLPDLDRLAEFGLFAKELGFPMRFDNPEKVASTLNQLTKASATDERLRMLLPLAIRTMAKAEYSTNNIGHYGLGFDYYSHFTSPIRRYSDVLLHRILFENLGKDIKKRDIEILEAKCKHISKQERKAMDAERDSVKYKQVEYMVDKIGMTFHGVISGMIDKGIFVEVIESKAEGLIPFKRLGKDYNMDANRLKAVSKHTGHELKMGSKVIIRLDAADLDTRLLEFTLIEVEED